MAVVPDFRLTDHTLVIDDGKIPVIIRRDDIRDATLERRALCVTTRGGRLVRAPFKRWQRAEVTAIRDELADP